MNEIKLILEEPTEKLREDQFNDGLGFGRYAKSLASVILSNRGPFNIGIYGNWGTGKSTLMRMVQKELEGQKGAAGGQVHELLTIWFNPWLYQDHPDPLRPLLHTILVKLKNGSNTRKIVETLLDISAISAQVALTAHSIPFNLMKRRKAIRAALLSDKESVNKEKETIEQLSELRENLARNGTPDNRKIVVFMDDLDRCPPQKAIRILEYIKLALGLAGFIFVIALDKNNLEAYLRKKWVREFDLDYPQVGRYFEKIIQFSFRIPNLSSFQDSLWKSSFEKELDLGDQDKATLKELFEFIFQACNHNPRATKILINNTIFDHGLSTYTQNSKTPHWSFFFVTRLMWKKFGKYFHRLAYHPDYLEAWNAYLNLPPGESPGSDLKDVLGPEALKDKELIDFCQTQPVRDWLENGTDRWATLNFYESEGQRAQRLASKKILWVLTPGNYTIEEWQTGINQVVQAQSFVNHFENRISLVDDLRRECCHTVVAIDFLRLAKEADFAANLEQVLSPILEIFWDITFLLLNCELSDDCPDFLNAGSVLRVSQNASLEHCQETILGLFQKITDSQ